MNKEEVRVVSVGPLYRCALTKDKRGIQLARAAIFVDGSYFGSVLRTEFSQRRIDYTKLSETLAGHIELLRTYYYDALPYQSDPPTRDEESKMEASLRFMNALQMLPRYQIRLGRLEHRGTINGQPKFEQKRVDILLGVDMVHLAAKGHITHAILIAGDSDYIPAITMAKQEGVVVILYHGTSYHIDIMREADEHYKLTKEFIEAISLTV